MADLPPIDLAREQLDDAFAPYSQYFAVQQAPERTQPFVEYAAAVASVGSLIIAAVQYWQSRQDRPTPTPDFAGLLQRLRTGKISPDDALKQLRQWEPDLSPYQVRLMIETGDRDAFLALLAELGLPASVATAALGEAAAQLDGD